MKEIVTPIFSSPLIHLADIGLDPTNLQKIVSEIPFYATGKNGDEGTYISQDQYLLNNLPEEKEHFLKIFNSIKNYHLKYENTEFKITTSWATCKKPGYPISKYHCHKNSMFSAVYYLGDDPEEYLPPLLFENFQSPNCFQVTPTEYNLVNATQWVVSPRAGELVIFPSYLFHAIGTSENTNNRHSIAMNFFPIGEIGTEDSRISVSLN